MKARGGTRIDDILDRTQTGLQTTSPRIRSGAAHLVINEPPDSTKATLSNLHGRNLQHATECTSKIICDQSSAEMCGDMELQLAIGHQLKYRVSPEACAQGASDATGTSEENKVNLWCEIFRLSHPLQVFRGGTCIMSCLS